MPKFKAGKVARSLRGKSGSTLVRPEDGEIGVAEAHDEHLPVFKPSASGLEGVARQLQTAPTTIARQALFQQMATQAGNSYARKVGTVMRDTVKPVTPPDELDTLVGLSSHAAKYSDEQLQEARQLILAESDGEKRTRLFELLQAKVPYQLQFNNKSKGYDVKGHKATALGGGMCNLTSLAMTLEGVGITMSQAKGMFPDTFEKYKEVWLAEESMPLEERQRFVAGLQEGAVFADFLEQLRVVHHFGWLTQGDTWQRLANLFGAKLVSLSGDGSHPKTWWMQHVEVAFQEGSSVLVGIDNHVIRLQAVTEGGLVFDDPAGHTNLGKKSQLRNGQQIDFSWDGGSGDDTVVPWTDAEKYPFRWIYRVNASTSKPTQLAARPHPQQVASAQAAPAHAPEAASPTPAHELLSQEEQQKVLAALQEAQAAGLDKNKAIDQGYFAIRSGGQIDPTNQKAVAEWLFIRDRLLPSLARSR